MNTLDTVKVSVPMDGVRYIDHSRYRKDGSYNHQGGVLWETHQMINPPVGLDWVKHKETQGIVEVKFSAKILGGDYGKLISLNTIEQAIDAINSTGAINLNPEVVVNQGIVFTVDSTQNLKVEGKVSDYVDALNTLRGNDRFTPDIYRKDRNNGMVFRGKQKTVKERLIFYDKGKDVKRDKKLLGSVSNPARFLAEFDGVLRCEQNHTSFDKIRKRFKIPDNTLINVLQSEANPNYDLFQKIRKPYVDLRLFEYYGDAGLSWSKFIKQEGYRRVWEMVGFDADLLRQEMVRFYSKGSNPSREFQIAREYLTRFIAEQQGGMDEGRYVRLLTELDALLRAA